MKKIIVTVTIKKSRRGGRWVDNRGNSWDKNRFSKREALIASKTLKNCSYCEDCLYCSQCEYCKYCFMSKQCFDCNNVKYCNYCTRISDEQCLENIHYRY